MPSGRHRIPALAATGLLALTPAPALGAAHDGARPAVPPDATRVVARCSGGPGKVSVTVLPRGQGAYRVTVLARGVREVDAPWRTALLVFARNGEEVRSTFLRRPVERSWTFTTDIAFEEPGAASFLVDARRIREDGTDADRCLVGDSPGHPEGAFTPCGRGLQVLALRSRSDGSLVVRHNLFSVAPGRRWALEVEAVSDSSGVGVGVSERSNDNGVVRTEVGLGEAADFEDSVFTGRAERPGGPRCWVRIDPGRLTAPDGGPAAPSFRRLLRRAGVEI